MTSRQERKKIWDQIKRLSSKLDTISSQVDRISQAIDSFEMYRYQYNQYNTIKIVGIPQVAETEPPEDTPSICLKLYSHALEQISQIRISTSYTRFRQNQLRPADRILLFVNLSGDYLKRSHVGNNIDLDLTPGSITRLASTTIIFHGCKICCTKPNALRPLITINTAGLKNSAI